MDRTIQRIVEDAEEDFGSSRYWREVLGVRPPPQAELVRVVSNRQQPELGAQPVLFLRPSDARLQFSSHTTSQPFINELFIWISFQSLEAAVKYLIINAERTHTVCVENQSSVIATELASVRSTELSTQPKFYFQRSESDVRDNSQLLPYRLPASDCSSCCSLEYDSSGRLLLGDSHYRYNIQHVKYIGLPLE